MLATFPPTVVTADVGMSSSTSAYPDSPPGSSSPSSSSSGGLSPFTPVDCEGGVSSSSLTLVGMDELPSDSRSMITVTTPVPSCGPSSESSVVAGHGGMGFEGHETPLSSSLYDGMGFEYGVGSLSGGSCGDCPPFLGGRVGGEKEGEVGLSLASMGVEGGHPIMGPYDGFVLDVNTQVMQRVQQPQTSLPPSSSSEMTEENISGVCLNDLVMSRNIRPASSWSTSSSASANSSSSSSSLYFSSSSSPSMSSPSSPLEPPAYPGNVTLPPGASALEPCSPIWAYFQPPDVQVHVQQSFLPYSDMQNEQQPFYGPGTTLINEFDQEVQRVREERREMWAQLGYSTNGATTPFPGASSLPLVIPSHMPTAQPIHSPASSMSSSPVATTFGQAYVQSMTNMSAPATGNTDFQQAQECSFYSYVPSAADVPYSCVGGSEMHESTMVTGENEQQGQLSEFPSTIDTSVGPTNPLHSTTSRPTTSSGGTVTIPEVAPSLSMTTRSPREVFPAPVFLGPDAESQQLRPSRKTLVVDTGASTGASSTNTLLMNVPPSPYPSLPAGQEQPKVSPGFLGRVRERKGSVRQFGRAPAVVNDVASASTQPPPPPPMPIGAEDSLLQQQKGSSTESRDVVEKGERTSGQKEDESSMQAQQDSAGLAPVLEPCLAAAAETSGSMTIEGRRMSLRKRKRESTGESERNEGGIVMLGSGNSPLAIFTHSPGMFSSSSTFFFLEFG